MYKYLKSQTFKLNLLNSQFTAKHHTAFIFYMYQISQLCNLNQKILEKVFFFIVMMLFFKY